MTPWEEDCVEYYGLVLTGRHGHWCVDWDGLPIDETCKEYHLSSDLPDDTNVPCRSCGFFNILFSELYRETVATWVVRYGRRSVTGTLFVDATGNCGNCEVET